MPRGGVPVWHSEFVGLQCCYRTVKPRPPLETGQLDHADGTGDDAAALLDEPGRGLERSAGRQQVAAQHNALAAKLPACLDRKSRLVIFKGIGLFEQLARKLARLAHHHHAACELERQRQRGKESPRIDAGMMSGRIGRVRSASASIACPATALSSRTGLMS